MFTIGDIPARVLVVTGLLLCAVVTAFALILNAEEAGPPSGWRAVFAGAALVGGAVLLLALFLRQIWTKPLRAMIDRARQAAEHPEATLEALPGPHELAMLAHTLDRMRRTWLNQRHMLERQREAVTSLMHQLHEGVVVVDARGCISLINPAAVRLLNLEGGGAAIGGGEVGSASAAEGLLGKPVERCIPQHDLQRMLHMGRVASRPGSVETRASAPTQEAQVAIELPDRTSQVLARASDLALPHAFGGAVHHRVLVLTDITELSEALQMKADFVANASHELRTPLSTIRAAVETLLHMDLVADLEDARRFLQLIDRHSGRLAEMSADLLDLSRVESPLVAHAASEIDVPAFLAEAQERFATRIAEKRLRYETQFTTSGATLSTAAYPLQLILDNLVDNAIKFSSADSPLIVRATLEPHEARFEVIDEGCGISETDRRRVFERFYQAERARPGDKRGTGLGLAIVKHATHVLGGSVVLQSSLGRGTRVTVTIPVEQGCNAAVPEHAPH